MTDFIPILFVHGHRGSFDQSTTILAWLENESTRRLPFRFALYTVDFGSGPMSEPAFSATVLKAQSLWLNSAIRSIQALHSSNQRLQCVGLSFGGVVLRHAVMSDVHPRILSVDGNSPSSSHAISPISVIYTLNSPHRSHPFPFDARMSELYSSLNHDWSRLSSSSSSHLSHLSLVSLSGGIRDQLIRGDLSHLDGIAPPSHSLHAYTRAIEGIDIEMNHDDIVRCAQMVNKLGEAIVTVAKSEQANRKETLHHMTQLRQHFLSTTPAKLHLMSHHPWSASVVDEGDTSATLSLSDTELSEIRVPSDIPVYLTSPSMRNHTNLHRPVRVLLPSISSTCRQTHSDHLARAYEKKSSGIYILDLDRPYTPTPVIHRITIPTTAPFEHLVVITNVPSEYICARLVTNAGRAIELRDWMIRPPENTAFVPIEARSKGLHLPQEGPESNLSRKNITHRWFSGSYVRSSTPASMIVLPAADIPKDAQTLELVFELPHESDGVNDTYAIVQFTLPTVLTTQWAVGWLGTIIRARHTSIIQVPVQDGNSPFASRIEFKSITPSSSYHPHVDNIDDKFFPIAYSVMLQSMEASWIQRDDSIHRTLVIPPTHMTSQPQTVHTLIFADPRFDYTIYLRTDISAILGQQLRAWYGIILIGAFLSTVFGLVGQIKEYQQLDEDRTIQTQTIAPLYLALAQRSLQAMVGAAMMSLLIHGANWMVGLGNTGFQLSPIICWLYLLVGWSLVVVGQYLTLNLHLRLVEFISRLSRRCPSHPAKGDHIRSNYQQSRCKKIIKLVVCVACLLMIIGFPLPTLSVAIGIFWLHTLRPDSESSQSQRRHISIQSLSLSVLFLFTGTILARAPTIYYQLRVMADWNLMELNLFDSLCVTICVLALYRMGGAGGVIIYPSDGVDYPDRKLLRSSRPIILHPTIIYAAGGMIAITAPFAMLNHPYRSLIGTSIIALAIVAENIFSLGRFIYSRLTGSHSSSPSPIFEVDGAALTPSSPSPSPLPLTNIRIDRPMTLGSSDSLTSKQVEDEMPLLVETSSRRVTHRQSDEEDDRMFGVGNALLI